MSGHNDDKYTRNKVLTAKLLKQGMRYHKLRKAFSKFYWRHFDSVSKYNVEMNTLLLQGLSEHREETAYTSTVVRVGRKALRNRLN